MAYGTATAQHLRAWLDAGLDAHRAGDLDRALASYRQILAVTPDHADALKLLGAALLQLGQAEQAVGSLEHAARRQRADPHLLANLGQAYLALGRYADAEKKFRQASRLAPHETQIHVGIATALAMAGKLDEAEAMLARLTVRFPDAPLVWLNFGNVMRDRERPQQALAAYLRALELDSRMAEAHIGAGSILHSQQRFAEAESEYRACIEVDPQHLVARQNLVSLALDMGRFGEAEQMCREIVRGAPALADAQLLLGTALGHQKRFIEARACYARAAELAPQDSASAQAYGASLMEAGHSAEGLRWLTLAARLDPHSDAIKRVTAGGLLAHGCLQDAWPDHAARSGAAELRRIHQAWNPLEPLPPLASAHLRVIGEQGLGDELFFLRYAPRLGAVAKCVTYRADPRLRALLQRASGFGALRAESAESAQPDATVLAGDLPCALGYAAHSAMVHFANEPAASVFSDLQRCISIFWPPPAAPLAIAALPERLAEIRDRLAALGPPPYIGVTWRAGIAPEEQTGHWVLFKSIDPYQLAQALHEVPGTIVSLQRKPARGETDALAAALGRPVHDFAGFNDDLEGMLALLSLLDEYVGVSNTNTHLRAAAGKTARVLVPAPAEWRWMQSGRSSPWFPGFSIYRQSLQGNWTNAVVRLKRDLSLG
ncbi:MAG TPA: tetratricopeptide repeat protein [Burkholderiales bacterium]|nr:tetratricopeptide repeat protein [Burkholderiales bacterium]